MSGQGLAGRIVITLLLTLVVVGDAADGVTAHRASSGAGLPGTLVVEGRDRVSVGKPPPVYLWAGRFRSDDGRVSRHAQLADPLPAKSARPGARIAVRWLSGRSDRVYLLHGTGAWTRWLESQSVWGFGILVGLVVWLWRRRLRRRGLVPAQT